MSLSIFLILFQLMAPQDDLLQKYQWKNRILLVFSPTKDAPEYKRQNTVIINNTADFKERDLKVLEFFNDDPLNTNPFSESDIKQLKSRFSINGSELTVILIGKDGTIKLQEQDVVQADKLFALIDSMPMRKSEMKNK